MLGDGGRRGGPGRAGRCGGCATARRWEDLFFRLLLERVEPRLGRELPTFLTHWPAAQAALARRDPADPRAAQRFELFVCGIELANAFDELTDPGSSATASSPTVPAEELGGPDWPTRRGFPRRARPRDAAVLRHRARLRPPGDDRRGRGPHRAGPVAPGRGVIGRMRSTSPSRISAHRYAAADRSDELSSDLAPGQRSSTRQFDPLEAQRWDVSPLRNHPVAERACGQPILGTDEET